jgi:type III restriction enzyme
MPIGADFPRDPYEVIDPSLRWYPGEAELELEEAAKLIPPLVGDIRQKVHEWRLAGYPGIAETSRALLRYWFATPHVMENADGTTWEFRYYFAQREAVETAVWLYEHESAWDPYSLMRYDSGGLLSQGMFPENWTRYVFKLATGAGKTKVLSLLIAWSYFHRKYEADSTMASNFLLIAPNIIVLDRLLDDFSGLKIFSADPVVPPNGFSGRNWNDDFQVTLHVQDEVGMVSPTGNIFLTNIHRVYEPPAASAATDEDLTGYFLGNKPVAKTTQKTFDLGDVVRNVDNLLVLNDEAHHVHDESMAWFKAIESIDAKMRQRHGHGISAQLDVTATPKHANGAVFVQTVCSYPLVEAIRQGVVKTPVVPDEVSRSKLVEKPSDKVYEQYADHLKLGYLEWAKRRDDLVKAGKKPILFIMTTTTTESDEVAGYMEKKYPDLTGKVLVIHTNTKGEISEKAGDKELQQLREASRLIDSNDSPYLCVVSVLMLREGWDVQNVISMVGLRPFSAASKVLPEQTLGRGLRRMFRGDDSVTEYVSVVGTTAFLEFVESVRAEGVEIDRVPMGNKSTPQKPLLIEVDDNDPDKDVAALDIPLPKLSNRIRRDAKNLDDLDVDAMPKGKLPIVQFTEAEQREIVFKDLDTEDIAWKTDLGEEVVATPQAVISYLTTELMRRMRLVGGQDVLYGKIKTFIATRLFETAVDLDDLNVLRNLSEPESRRFLYETFATAINELTLVDVGVTELISTIKLRNTRPSIVNNQEFVQSKKTLFNRVIGDSHLELRFAAFLDQAKDVEAFIKITRGMHFYIEYINATGELAHYIPDFLVRTSDTQVYVVETKGLQDLDVAPKWKRLVRWCQDATEFDKQGRTFTPLFVTQEDFDEIEKSAKTMDRLVQYVIDRKPIGVD